jgi:ubiquinone/menaquinone biosynthesis C-methylase UbiE
MKRTWTGERLESFIFTRDAIDHLHRYAISKSYIKNKIVLDIASGEGYGSNILSENAKFVYGVDIDKKTIYLAKKKYQKDNLEFLVGSADLIPLEDNAVDVVVSFETIEHHDKHLEMFKEIRRVLKPEGTLIISTPDKLEYSDKREFVNPFHVKELYKKEFESLVSMYFSKRQDLLQTFINGNSVIYDSSQLPKVDVYSGNYHQINQQESTNMYLIAIASDYEFENQKISIFNGQEILEARTKEIQDKVYESNTYKFGHFVLGPLKFLKKVLK